MCGVTECAKPNLPESLGKLGPEVPLLKFPSSKESSWAESRALQCALSAVLFVQEPDLAMPCRGLVRSACMVTASLMAGLLGVLGVDMAESPLDRHSGTRGSLQAPRPSILAVYCLNTGASE